MLDLFILPTSLFNQSFTDAELYEKIYKQFDKQVETFLGGTDEKLTSNGEKSFFVPSNAIAAEYGGEIRGIDLVVYVYLCLLVFNNQENTVKLEINGLANRTGIKKTQIKHSINHLVREQLISESSRSGYYTVLELELLLG